MKATRYAKGLSKGIFWLTSLALLLALVLPSDGPGIAQASPGPDTVTLRPDGPDDETNLTIGGSSPAPSNWESVDEETPDEDSTYVYHDGTDYLRDLYNIVDHSLGSGKINSVTVHARCNSRKTPEQASLKIVLKSGTTTEESVEKTLTKDYSNYSNTWTTNPDTGSAFTWGEVDSLQVGVSLREDKAGTGDYSGCTQVWVDVDYTPPFSTTIEIRAQDYSTTVTDITFPEGAPGSEVSQPYNDADGSGSPQGFGDAGVAKPVVTLYNGGSATYTIWYNIATFTEGIVSSEYYLINAKGAACTSADSITNAVTFDADTSTGTTIATGAGNEKDLYLKITLSDVAGKSGTSALTILGEA